MLLTAIYPGAVFCAEASGAKMNTALEDMALEDLLHVVVNTVSGASKYEQQISEAPASVTVVTADEIREYGYRNLAELLQGVRGFFITNDRNYFYAGIRGLSFPGDYGTRILLLVDGIRLNDNIYGQTAIGFDFPVDVDLIERVEIVRGPSQSLYGNNADLGVINVITRQGGQLQGGEAAASAGSFATYGGRLSYGNVFGDRGSVLLSASFLDSDGERIHFKEFDSPQTNNGWAERGDGLRLGTGLLKASFADFTLEGIFGSTRKNVPTASWGTIFNDSDYRTIDTRAIASLSYNHQFPDKLDLLIRLTGSWYRYSGIYPYEGDNGRYLQREGSQGNWWGAEFNLVKKVFNRHKIVFGGEYEDDYTQDQWLSDPFTYWQSRQSGRNWGVFLQDEFRVLENLTFHAGLRYDHFNTFGDTVNYRFALLYHPLSGTTLKALYGTAFRAPNAYELYYSPPATALRNEDITSYELILEQTIGRNIMGSVSAYLNRLDHLITQGDVLDANGNFAFVNRGKVETRGIEAELQGVWEGGWRGRASYSYQQARDVETGARLPNSPLHLAKVAVTAPLYKEKLFLGVEELYVGRKKALNGSTVGDYFLTNLTLSSRELLPDLDLSASLYNLLDEDYFNPGGEEHLVNNMAAVPQPGRTFQVKLTYHFL